MRHLGLTGRVAGDERVQLADLKRRYVAGSVDEREFEREVSRIEADEARAAAVTDVSPDVRAIDATDSEATP